MLYFFEASWRNGERHLDRSERKLDKMKRVDRTSPVIEQLGHFTMLLRLKGRHGRFLG